MSIDRWKQAYFNEWNLKQLLYEEKDYSECLCISQLAAKRSALAG